MQKYIVIYLLLTVLLHINVEFAYKERTRGGSRSTSNNCVGEQKQLSSEKDQT